LCIRNFKTKKLIIILYGFIGIFIFRGVAIFAKAFMSIPAQQAAKTTRPLMPAAAPAVLLHSLDTRQGVSNIVLAMTRRDVGKPAFSLRKKRFVKTHALSLLGTTRLLSRSEGKLVIEKVGPIKNPLTIIAIFAAIAEISGTVVLPFMGDRKDS
jgi:hypothetical protein